MLYGPDQMCMAAPKKTQLPPLRGTQEGKTQQLFIKEKYGANETSNPVASSLL